MREQLASTGEDILDIENRGQLEGKKRRALGAPADVRAAQEHAPTVNIAKAPTLEIDLEAEFIAHVDLLAQLD
jgi:hypothetical protein